MKCIKCLFVLCFLVAVLLSSCVHTQFGGAENGEFNENVNISAERTEEILTASAGINNINEETVAPALSENVEVGSRILDLLFGKKNEENHKPTSLIPGGGVFGVKIKQKHVTVIDSPGIPALKSGDAILSVNGCKVSTAAEVKQLVQKSEGKSLTIRALHQEKEIGVEILPSFENGEYKIGVSLRDGAAGLGTVTFIDPETGIFGGLGHAICDSDSGEIVSMSKGEVCGVILGGIHKGESGKPGELCGVLTEEDLGDLHINSDCGVFGVLTDNDYRDDERVPIGTRDEIAEGDATIISTLKNGKSAKYKIHIYDIDRNSDGSKCFRIRVTDEALKAITGGIVRGMSGSPIIQNGKLVGAVTHVLVADPTEGYGIFIENMLASASEISLPKAA